MVLLLLVNITYRGGVGRLGKGGGLELGTWIGLGLGRSVGGRPSSALVKT